MHALAKQLLKNDATLTINSHQELVKPKPCMMYTFVSIEMSSISYINYKTSGKNTEISKQKNYSKTSEFIVITGKV